MSQNPFVWIDEFCRQPAQSNWLVRDYLTTDSLACLFGDSQGGKSFVAIDLACHIAHGMHWRNKAVRQGTVVYIAAEGAHGLGGRFVAWHERYDKPFQKNIIISTVPARLCEPGNAAELVGFIKETLSGINPVMIVLDTLDRNFGNGSQSHDMGLFLNGMIELRQMTGACIMTVHHPGHSNKERGRGGSELPAGIDWEYCIERTGDPQNPETLVTTMTCKKAKDHALPPPLAWSWCVRELATWKPEEVDGALRHVTSIVLEPGEPTTEPVRLSPEQHKALDALRELYHQQRETLEASGHNPAGARVLVLDWQEAMRKLIPDKSRRSRVRSDLEKGGFVRLDSCYVFLT